MMQLDHVAYLVRDTQKSLSAMVQMAPRVILDRMPLPSQQAYITMVQTGAANGALTELVEPFAGNAAMHKRLAREASDCVLYHVGYRVADFDARFLNMRRNGWLPLTQPFEGIEPGCRASHLYHPSFGIVEILQGAA